ncbi:MAG: hypothetical protein DMD88_05775 [Candidatus Rokuibacteriota bacterium]|nr:MAG: hypothetical protein DMD88_05775 [Candidatus Rokubacteria bacterium]
MAGAVLFTLCRRHCGWRPRDRAAGDRAARTQGPDPLWSFPCTRWSHRPFLGGEGGGVVSERIRRLSAAGFGLAELAVTLALVAVVTAVSAPSLVAFRRAATLRAASEELATAINLGRQLAISRNAPVCIAVVGSDVRFEGTGAGACSGVPLPGVAPVRLASGLVVSAVGASVLFTGLGAASPAGRYTVVSPADSGTRSVVVAASGRVSIQ